jgi:uncharacterized protein (TIGR00645 family)
MEKAFEQILFALRWLLAPLYLGLGLLLVMFALQFFRELLHLVEAAPSLVEVDLILMALTLIDLTLVASLIVMVMLSGYENFVSKLDLEGAERSLSWLGKLDSGSLKIKVAASIVAISSIHLLKAFMNYNSVPTEKILVLIATHLTFVVSALLLAVMDRIIPMHR